MNNSSFVTKIGIATAILLLIQFSLSYFDVLPIPIAMYIMTGVFGLISYLIYSYLSRANSKNPKKFITKFMGALGLKLFASIIFITIYLFFSEQQYKVSMAIGLFVVYMTSNILILSQITKEIRSTQAANKATQ